MISYSDRVFTSTLSDLITSGQHLKKLLFSCGTLAEFTSRPIKLRIRQNQRFTKFITFIPSQQLTKLSDL